MFDEASRVGPSRFNALYIRLNGDHQDRPRAAQWLEAVGACRVLSVDGVVYQIHHISGARPCIAPRAKHDGPECRDALRRYPQAAGESPREPHVSQ